MRRLFVFGWLALAGHAIAEPDPALVRARAADLMTIMERVSPLAAGGQVRDPAVHGRGFTMPLQDVISAWDKVVPLYEGGDYGYCRDAATNLDLWGMIVADKRSTEKQAEEWRGKYAKAVEKCRVALKAAK